MIAGASPIENDPLDSFSHRRLCCERAKTFGADGIGGELIPVGRTLAAGGSRRQSHSSGVVDELHVNVLICETDTHARALFGAGNFLADSPTAALRQVMFLFSSHGRLLTLIAYCTVLPSLRITRSSV